MTTEIVIEQAPPALNVELLNAEIVALGIAGFEGLVIRNGSVIALFASRPRGADIARIEAAARVHDHTKVTPAQQRDNEERDLVLAKRLAILAAKAPRTPQQIDDALDAIVIVLKRAGLL